MGVHGASGARPLEQKAGLAARDEGRTWGQRAEREGWRVAARVQPHTAMLTGEVALVVLPHGWLYCCRTAHL